MSHLKIGGMSFCWCELMGNLSLQSKFRNVSSMRNLALQEIVSFLPKESKADEQVLSYAL